MLKHVSSSQLSPFKGGGCGKLLGGGGSSGGSISGTLSSRQDSVSLASFGSSGGQEALSSRSSSTSSIHEMHHILHNHSSHQNQHKLQLNPTLSPHIVINRNERVIVKVVVKVYARVLCADMEYKTLSISQSTSSREVIKLLLNKFRMKHRDPNLFYLTMEVWVKKTGMPIRTIMVLDDEARPAELQACHPRGDSKFCLQMRRGGLVKIYDACLMQGSLYKSLLVSDRTTVEELIQLLLHCYNSKEWAAKFSLYEVSTTQTYERRLHHRDYPLLVQQAWPNPQQFVFQLRRNSGETGQKRRDWHGSQNSVTSFQLYV